ncbi:hypothetical protein TEA_019007 [Camellia sinensis var. sinensis]|uniref:Uncharacterized protein n=1 Tax=Camellia sinensis var. sinensis TaxID=542762 RepID=A0A4S4D068_CAMSN|nr:hypothetical protein TEA_019007 [Camellia sinensis var. sinensis]
MDLCQNGVECNTDFWPVEHPIEPPDEDQPVKCPKPDSSVMNVNGCTSLNSFDSLKCINCSTSNHHGPSSLKLASNHITESCDDPHNLAVASHILRPASPPSVTSSNVLGGPQSTIDGISGAR